jgi:glycine C-acetyltransferase
MEHLEDRLRRSRAARFRIIATDGVFPLSGLVANLRDIFGLAAKYNALVAVDDSQGIGIIGEHGRGTHDQLGLTDRIDLVTGTFGAALGGGAGGFVAGRKEIVTWLRQKSRAYLSSTALPPASVAAALKSLELLRSEPQLRETLDMNVRLFRDALAEHGLWTAEGDHPAVAVLIRHAVAAQRLTDFLYRKGVFAIGFCHPVVPEGAARIRAQVTVRHSQKALSKAADAFAEGATELKIARTFDNK